MNWFKKHKLLFASIAAISIILCIAYFCDGQSPKETEIPTGYFSKTTQIAESKNKLATEKLPEEETKKQDTKTEKTEEEPDSEKKDATELPKEVSENKQKEETPIQPKNDAPSKPSSQEDNPVSADTPKETSSNKLTCRLSVRCDTILNNMDKVKEEKKQIIPKDGIIYPEKEVEFFENETAFNVLLREMKQNHIHFEFEKTPAYNSMYVEGIGNIYEFDAGELSGWLYKVNGNFLSYSLSKYPVKNGDRIEIIYTCNMGSDVGGASASLQ